MKINLKGLNKMKKSIKSIIAMIICSVSILSLDVMANESGATPHIAAENTAVTTCWMGTCGHKSTTYSYSNLKTTGSGTEYKHLGRHVEGGDSIQISESYSYTSEISAGLEFGTDKAKASLGVSGSLTSEYGYATTLNNNTSSRQYVHASVQYADKSSTITKNTRTYNPAYDLVGINNYCQFSYSSCYPKGRIMVSMGYKLLSNIRNDF